MAADNDDAYAITPAFILETVQAAKSLLLKKKLMGPRDHEKQVIRKFLEWPEHRVVERIDDDETKI